MASPGKPDLPVSISPGWARTSYESSGLPAGLPEGAQPKCWKAVYAGAQAASAVVWACGYGQESSAFHAMQTANVGANTVKFQAARYLVVVRWSGGTRTDVTALMGGLEKAVK